MGDQSIILNGINGATGGYYTEPMDVQEALPFVSHQPDGPETLNVLRNLHQQAAQPHLGLAFDRDPRRPEEAGWGIVFHESEDTAVRAALQPLIDHRKRQITESRIVRVLEYKQDESVQQFLARYGVAPGSVEPTRVPMYLLLAGSADKIPIEFGHLLDVEYCVGRLDFDTTEAYSRYVENVIRYETAADVPNRREVVFWGPQHVNDAPTLLSSQFLVKPLAQGDPDKPTILQRVSERSGKAWTARYFTPVESTKANLLSALRRDAGTLPPALLFTASHGLGWPLNHPLQPTATGALLCADYPGANMGPVGPHQYLTAADLPPDARVSGMVTFHFACFGAGTPRRDRFLHKPNTPPPQIAPAPFFSPLPKALMSHPNGGALGVIGHVERAWMSSIAGAGSAAGPQLIPFENVLGYILTGLPLGYALKDFNERYAALSTNLGAMLEKRGFGLTVPDEDLARRWTERNDAEAYTLLGDPGIRLRIDKLS
jgi:hypothetical protein